MKVFLVNPGMVDDYIYELSSSLSKDNVSVYLFGSDSYEEREINFFNFNYYNKFFNVEKIKLPRLKKILKGFLYVFLQLYVLRSILREKPDVLHLQWCRIPLIDCIFIKLFKRYTTVVFTLHNTTINHGDKSSKNSLLNIGYKRFLQNTSSIILHTEYSKIKFLTDFPDFLDKVKVVPHGILSFPKQKKKKFNFNFSSDFVLLFFGHIERYKGLDVLVEAMSYLKDYDVKLLVAGKANISLEPLKERIGELSLEDNIYWHTHFINDEDVEEIYSYCKIVALPHRHIDQSGILMSAINFGKPVVASNIGGFSEIIEDGKQGLLFKPEDPLDLAKKIIKIIEDDKILEMNKSIIHLRNSWKTWEQISLTTLEIYKDSITSCHVQKS